MAELKKFTSNETKGKISYNAGIVKGIVSLAVSEVAGVAISTKTRSSKLNDAIKLKFDDNGICVDVNINVYTGYIVPDVAFNIQQNIKQSVESMSEYKISEINVNVMSVILQEEVIAAE